MQLSNQDLRGDKSMNLDAITQQELPGHIMMYLVTGPITNYVADVLDFAMTGENNPNSLHLVNLAKATDITDYGIQKLVLIQELLATKGHCWALTLDGTDNVLFEGIARGIKKKGVFIFKTREEAINYLLQPTPATS